MLRPYGCIGRAQRRVRLNVLSRLWSVTLVLHDLDPLPPTKLYARVVSSATTSMTCIVEDVVPAVARRGAIQASYSPANFPRCSQACSQARLRAFAPMYMLTRASREPDTYQLCGYDLRRCLTTSNCQSGGASDTYLKPPLLRKVNKLPADVRWALFDRRCGRLFTIVSRSYIVVIFPRYQRGDVAAGHL